MTSLTSPPGSPSYLDKLLLRWGRGYLSKISLLVQLASLIAASLGIYYIALNVTLNPNQLRYLIVSVLGLVVIANLIVPVYGYRISPHTRGRLEVWAKTLGAEQADASSEVELQAWREITAYPWRFAAFSALIAFFQVILPAALYMYLIVGLGLPQAMHVIVGGLISATGLVVYYFFTLEWALAPVRRVLLPHSHAQQRAGMNGIGVQLRLLVVYGALIVTTLLMVGALGYQKVSNTLMLGIDLAANLRSFQVQLTAISTVALLLSVGFSYALARSVANPIRRLIRTMGEVETGHIAQRASVTSTDELGHLVVSFNRMVDQLETLQTGLEQQVAERTRDLERRAVQLLAAAEVGSAITSIRDLDELLTQVTHLVSERFGFYHVGIFLLDAAGKYAVLRAANSPGGQRMLARGHKLKAGEIGIVGYVTGTKQPRIALDVGQDAIFFDNPDLPETRSEMALPLIAGNQLLGVLDVQSTQEAAFTGDLNRLSEDTAILQVLADQVAVAIDNARLLSENQAAMEAMHRAYGELSRETWFEKLGGQPLGFRRDADGLAPITGFELSHAKIIPAPQQDEGGPAVLTIPIEIRGHLLGVIKAHKPQGAGGWLPEEKNLLEAITGQLEIALDSARLHESTQKRAEQEHLIGEVTARMRETLDIETVLQTAAHELRQVLDLAEVEVRMGPGADELHPSIIDQNRDSENLP